MRERDRRVGWRQILTLMGVGSFPEEEWQDICMDYQLSWDRISYIDLAKKATRKGPGPSPIMKHRNSTAPGRAVASSHVKRRKTSPSPSTLVASPFRRRNSIASPSTCIRRNSMAPPSTCIRRNSMALPSSPTQLMAPTSTLTRRNSMAPTSTPTRRNSMAPPSFPTQGQAWDSSFCTPKLTNSVADHRFNSSSNYNVPGSMNNPVICAIKQSESPFDFFVDFKDYKPFTPISPISPTKSRDSVASKQEMNLEIPSAPEPANSSISASAKVKSKQKPISSVKHVTESGDELDDDQMLVNWKRKALKAKESLPKKPPGDIGVDPPVKRRRGRPTRDEVARRLEEKQAQALKRMNQTANQFTLPTNRQPNPVGTKPEEDYEPEPQPLELCPPARAQQKPPKQREQQKPPKQREQQKQQKPIYITKSIKSLSKAPKQHHQQPATKPRCRSPSPVSDQEGSDSAKLSNVAVQAAISDERATRPAHMPTMAMDLKCRSQVPPGNKETKAAEDEHGRPKPNGSHGRSMFSKMLGHLAMDEHELVRNQTDFMLNDVEAEELLVDDAMELTSPVGGGEGDRDELDMDFRVTDESVANHLALIDPQEEMSINRCLEALDTQSPSEIDQCLTPPKAIHDQLTHTSEFFEELSGRPPVNVNCDKDSLLWPYLEVAEVLDYEADSDVLTLAASSDELEDEAPREKAGESEPRNRNAQIEPAKAPNPESLRTFRIPKMRPEVLKAQPTVMHSLYEQEHQEDQEPSKATKKKKRSPKNVATPTPEPAPAAAPAVTDDVRKMREEARAARRTKKTNPKFGPCYRSVPDALTPNYGPQDLAPMFGPADLAPHQAVPEAPHQHAREASQYAPSHRHSLPEASQYAPENLATSNRQSLPAEVPASRTSQYVPENLTTRNREPALHYVPNNLATRDSRDNRPAPVPTPMSTSNHQSIPVKHWMMEVFGAKCLPFLDNNCHSANCNHTMSPVGEVESRLFSMKEKALAHTYRQALRSFSIFGQYFESFADIFERRNLGQYLLQMLVNCRLYRSTAAPMVGHIFRALQRCGMEREAMGCIMKDLWFPGHAHKFRDLTIAILEILEAANWQDYVVQLMELHKTYKFLLPGEFIIRILRWAEATKNEPLQIEAMTMTLEDMPKYARNSTLLSLIAGISQMPASENHNANPIAIPGQQPAGAGPAPSPVQRQQQQQQYPGTSCIPNTNPSFFPELERQPPVGGLQQQQYPGSNWIDSPSPNLPGAGPGPSLIQPQQHLAQMWSQNPSLNLPGARPAAGQQQQPQQQQQRNLNPHLPGANPSVTQGQQQQNPASYWNPNPNLAQQHDRLPGANTGPSLIQRSSAPENPASNWNRSPNPNLPGASSAVPQGQQQQHQNPASNWNRNPNPNLPASYWNPNPNLAQQHDRLPGANTGPSLIQRNPAPGQQQPLQNPEANWRSQANAFNTFNRADDSQYRPFPQGFQ